MGDKGLTGPKGLPGPLEGEYTYEHCIIIIITYTMKNNLVILVL